MTRKERAMLEDILVSFAMDTGMPEDVAASWACEHIYLIKTADHAKKVANNGQTPKSLGES